MSSLPDYISALQEVIQRLHKCQAIYCDTVLVEEKFHGKTLWKGNVEIFSLRGHSKAVRCFAWLHDDSKSRRYVALPESSAIASPEMAVRAIIAYGSQIVDCSQIAGFDAQQNALGAAHHQAPSEHAATGEATD